MPSVETRPENNKQLSKRVHEYATSVEALTNEWMNVIFGKLKLENFLKPGLRMRVPCSGEMCLVTHPMMA